MNELHDAHIWTQFEAEYNELDRQYIARRSQLIAQIESYLSSDLKGAYTWERLERRFAVLKPLRQAYADAPIVHASNVKALDERFGIIWQS